MARRTSSRSESLRSAESGVRDFVSDRNSMRRSQAAFKKLYGDFWGPRLEHILRNALLALLEVPGATLLTVLRLLTDTRFRQPLVAKLSDPVVRAFWQREFAALPMKFQLEAVAPIQNKIGHFVSSPLLRNIMGQGRSSLDLRAVLDEGRVLLVNL